VLKYSPQAFLQLDLFFARCAIDGYFNEYYWKLQNQRLETKRLAYSIAAIQGGDSDLLASLWDFTPAQPITPITDSDKLDAISNHFKPII
jgi:hypothetical protein